MPQTDGRLLIRAVDGERMAELHRDTPYFREAGVEHDVINVSGRGIAFVEIEMKQPQTSPCQRTESRAG